MIARTISAFCATALMGGMLAAQQPAAQPAPKAASERMICQSVPDQGSRFVSRRICHTRAEWAELRRQTRDTIDHIQNSRAGSGQ